MDFFERFKTPEEYIRHEITANKGTQSNLMKGDMIELIMELKISSDVQALKKKNKDELYELLKENIGIEQLAEVAHIGISSNCFQKKFDVDNSDIKFMASHGFISVTGKERFHAYGKYLYANLYSVFDFYRLTYDDVHGWIEANRPKYRKKQQ